jgi:hypothetical protein
MQENGQTYYQWGFTVNVDGQVYWTSVWVTGPNANNAASYDQVAAAVTDLLESDDPEQGVDGIAQGDDQNDGPGDYGDYGDYGGGQDFGDDDGGDGALAGGGDGFGDSA